MQRENIFKWALVGGAVTCFAILGAVFGPRSVRGVLRATAFVVMILGLAILSGDQLVIALQKRRRQREQSSGDGGAQSRSRTAYNGIIARSDAGIIVDGYVIGMIHEGEKGYTPQPEFGVFADLGKARLRPMNLIHCLA